MNNTLKQILLFLVEIKPTMNDRINFIISTAALRREGDYSCRRVVDSITFSGDRYILNYNKLNRNGGEFFVTQLPLSMQLVDE